jgi:parallel beta-helix repeat protein
MPAHPRRWPALVVSVTLVALSALAPARARPVAAAGGGTFTVDTAHDSNTPGDSELGLREAIAIANGSLLGPFSLAEKTHLQGCTFNGSGNITNNCGGGHNLIRFTPTLTQVLLATRPDTITVDSLTLDGAVDAGQIVIDGQNQADNGFMVAADQFTLKNAAVINLRSAGNGVAVESVTAHKGLLLLHDSLGVPPGAASCNDPRLISRNANGVLLENGAGTGAPGDGTAYLADNVIGCSGGSGVNLIDTNNVYVGQTPDGAPSRNWIGADASGHDLGNQGEGVEFCCSLAAHDNQLTGNTIAHNAGGGVQLNVGTANTLSGNDVAGNGVAGVLLVNSAATTLASNDLHDNAGPGLWLAGGLTTGTAISGGAIHGNGAAGITEGAGVQYNTWRQLGIYDNFGLGIDKNDNGLPDATGTLSLTNVITTSQGLSVTGQLNGLYVPGLYGYQVEVYALAPDPSGYGEGRRYIGTTLIQPGLPKPKWSLLDPGWAGCYTAVLTLNNLSHPADSTSFEFAANLGRCASLLYLPLVRRS